MKSRALSRRAAFVAGGAPRDVLTPFSWDGVDYRVPCVDLRHLTRECPALAEAVSLGGWVDRVTNDAELTRLDGALYRRLLRRVRRGRTACRGAGRRGARRDIEEDAIRGRARLARRIRDGLVRGAVIER